MSIETADVILADPTVEMFQLLIRLYQNWPDKHIESYMWVKKCVERGALVYTPFVYHNPGGRCSGEK